jgi:hypothetical protein
MRLPFRVLFMILVGFVLLATVSSLPRAQSSGLKTSEMTPEVKKYENYVTDFHAAEQDEKGENFETADFLQSTSLLAEERVLALDYTSAMYKSIPSTNDRGKAARIVKEQLEYYARQFDSEATRVAEMLKFVKVPATIQLGIKLKEDLRTTKDKLDKISASLDLPQ